MKRYYLQLALRGLLRHRTQTLLIIVTMAIGIASCMTAYTILNALMADPIAHGSRHLYLVSMDSQPLPKPDSHGSSSSYPTLLKLRDAQALVDARQAVRQAYLSTAMVEASADDGKKHAGTQLAWMTSSQALPLFGMSLRYGRAWTHAEAIAQAPFVVIDEHLSQKLFGVADGVGRSLHIDGHLFRVIGIIANWAARRQFFDLEQMNFTGVLPIGILMPLQSALAAAIGPFAPGLCDGKQQSLGFGAPPAANCRWLETWVRLDTPQQVKSYRRYLLDYATAQHATGRFPRAPKIALHGMNGWVAQNNGVPSSAHINLWLSLAFLALCMVNVTGLLLARFLRGSYEIAVRRTLGATRASVFAQHLIEAGGVSLLGGVLAVPLTLFGLWLVRQQQIGYASVAHLNLPMFITLFALSVAVGLIVGVLPAWRASTLSPALQVKTN
jgi:putative ABC transport system permease protein